MGKPQHETHIVKACPDCGQPLELRRRGRRESLRCVACRYSEPLPTYFTLVREKAPLLPGMDAL